MVLPQAFLLHKNMWKVKINSQYFGISASMSVQILVVQATHKISTGSLLVPGYECKNLVLSLMTMHLLWNLILHPKTHGWSLPELYWPMKVGKAEKCGRSATKPDLEQNQVLFGPIHLIQGPALPWMGGNCAEWYPLPCHVQTLHYCHLHPRPLCLESWQLGWK